MFRDIELTLPGTGKVLIDKVTGTAKAGRVLALMGPSGVCVCVCLTRRKLTRRRKAGRDCGGEKLGLLDTEYTCVWLHRTGRGRGGIHFFTGRC